MSYSLSAADLVQTWKKDEPSISPVSPDELARMWQKDEQSILNARVNAREFVDIRCKEDSFERHEFDRYHGDLAFRLIGPSFYAMGRFYEPLELWDKGDFFMRLGHFWYTEHIHNRPCRNFRILEGVVYKLTLFPDTWHVAQTDTTAQDRWNVVDLRYILDEETEWFLNSLESGPVEKAKLAPFALVYFDNGIVSAVNFRTALKYRTYGKHVDHARRGHYEGTVDYIVTPMAALKGCPSCHQYRRFWFSGNDIQCLCGYCDDANLHHYCDHDGSCRKRFFGNNIQCLCGHCERYAWIQSNCDHDGSCLKSFWVSLMYELVENDTDRDYCVALQLALVEVERLIEQQKFNVVLNRQIYGNSRDDYCQLAQLRHRKISDMVNTAPCLRDFVSMVMSVSSQHDYTVCLKRDYVHGGFETLCWSLVTYQMKINENLPVQTRAQIRMRHTNIGRETMLMYVQQLLKYATCELYW
jgi:hypothetical protein